LTPWQTLDLWLSAHLIICSGNALAAADPVADVPQATGATISFVTYRNTLLEVPAEGGLLTPGLVFTNPNNETLSVELVSGPGSSFGKVQVFPNGSFTFTPTLTSAKKGPTNVGYFQVRARGAGGQLYNETATIGLVTIFGERKASSCLQCDSGKADSCVRPPSPRNAVLLYPTQ
jgi:hypothetical protein